MTCGIADHTAIRAVCVAWIKEGEINHSETPTFCLNRQHSARFLSLTKVASHLAPHTSAVLQAATVRMM
jgi:hypothetical protein